MSNVKKVCSKCGRRFHPAGLTQHEKYCSGPGYKPTPRWTEGKKGKGVTADVVETAFYLSPDDSAMFYILCHLLSAKRGEDTIYNLTVAKTMIDIKIESLKA